MNIELMIEEQYIKNSTYRTKTIKAIGPNIKTPTQIGLDSDILINHISKTLGELKQKDIVECINEEAHKGRLYRLTEKGQQIYKDINGE